jgi:hypothetical protein
MYSVRSDSLPWERLRTGGRPAASVKSAAATIARAREREREEEKINVDFKYELVTSI